MVPFPVGTEPLFRSPAPELAVLLQAMQEMLALLAVSCPWCAAYACGSSRYAADPAHAACPGAIAIVAVEHVVAMMGARRPAGVG